MWKCRLNTVKYLYSAAHCIISSLAIYFFVVSCSKFHNLEVNVFSSVGSSFLFDDSGFLRFGSFERLFNSRIKKTFILKNDIKTSWQGSIWQETIERRWHIRQRYLGKKQAWKMTMLDYKYHKQGETKISDDGVRKNKFRKDLGR